MHGEYAGGTPEVEGSGGTVFLDQAGPNRGEADSSYRHILLVGHVDPLLDVQAVVPGDSENTLTRAVHRVS